MILVLQVNHARLGGAVEELEDLVLGSMSVDTSLLEPLGSTNRRARS